MTNSEKLIIIERLNKIIAPALKKYPEKLKVLHIIIKQLTPKPLKRSSGFLGRNTEAVRKARSRSVVDLSTHVVYPSIKDASAATHCSTTTIITHCKKAKAIAESGKILVSRDLSCRFTYLEFMPFFSVLI